MGEVGRLGRYLLLEETSRGKYGVLYRARDTRDNQPMAVLVLYKEPWDSTDQVERLKRIAHEASRLTHAHIVQIRTVGIENETHFIASVPIEGRTLASALPELTFDEKLRYFEQIVQAVGHAHGQGVAHLALEPQNVLLTADRRAVLTGFGMHDGPLYKSPEQISEQTPDLRSDVWALGALLYQMLTDSPPFEGTQREVVPAILRGRPAAPRTRADVPRPLELICLKALSKEPSRRYPSAAAMAEELTRWRCGAPVKAARASARRRVVVTAVLLLIVGLWGQQQQRGLRSAEPGPLSPVPARLEAKAGAGDHQRASRQRDPIKRQPPTGPTEAPVDRNPVRPTDPRDLADLQQRAALRLQQGRIRDALADHSRLIELSPERAQQYVARGRAHLRNLDPQQALADFNQAVFLAPELAAARLARADLLLGQGQLELALADYSRAIDLAPRAPAPLIGRATARHQLQQLAGALDDYTGALALAPRNQRARLGRARVRRALRDFPGAIADISQAIWQQPDDATLIHDRGMLQIESGDLNGAIADFTRAIQLDPRHVPSWLNRGDAYFNLGEYRLALVNFEWAVEHAPGFWQSWAGCGAALARLGQKSRALQMLRHAVDIAPEEAKADLGAMIHEVEQL